MNTALGSVIVCLNIVMLSLLVVRQKIRIKVTSITVILSHSVGTSGKPEPLLEVLWELLCWW